MVEFGPATFVIHNPSHGEYLGFPLSGQITDTFETWEQWRKDLGLGPHSGLDISGTAGAPIRAPAEGVVLTNAQHTDFGNYLVLRHPDGSHSLYAHMRVPSPLAQGAAVARGDVIGEVGMTGTATGTHLHWMHTPPNNPQISRAVGFLNPLLSVRSDIAGSAPILAEPVQPTAPPAGPPAVPFEVHVVVSGDNLSTLAGLWGCTQDDICQINNITNPNLIFIGQKLLIPRH